MMMFGLLLLPMVLAIDRTVERDNYVLTFHHKTLKYINVNGQSSDILDLSNLNIKSVKKDVFANFNNLKILNLSNNWIRRFDEFTFANLTKLENLNLANNPLSSINFSHGPKNLKTLDVTNTKLYFKPGDFYGLPKFTNIMTRGRPYDVIYAATFENPSNLTSRQRKIHPTVICGFPLSNEELKFNELKLKVCVEDGHLKSLDVFKENENLSDDCREVYSYYDRLGLTRLGIRTINSKWYRLQEHHGNTLGFYNNEIAQLTKELLNDLPAEIKEVDLSSNKIERLQRGNIENHNPIELLNLGDNMVSEIEDGALENLNITGMLDLYHNKLMDTKFLDSLPSNIAEVNLRGNGITEISAGNFSRFKSFATLNLSNNNLTEAKARRLRDFWSLKSLDLSYNGLRKIEPGFFRDLKSLEILYLNDNVISRLDNGVFAGLESITELNLNMNKLTEISSNLFCTLPISLESLSLQYNLIETLRSGTFVTIPTRILSLDGNRISKIEKGCFDLPYLEFLYLRNNLLTEMDGDSFEGLSNLYELSLSDNVITTIKKRAAKNLNSLDILELSNNPIKRLENGALFGLSKTTESCVEMDKVYLEFIQAGVFDDV